MKIIEICVKNCVFDKKRHYKSLIYNAVISEIVTPRGLNSNQIMDDLQKINALRLIL